MQRVARHSADVNARATTLELLQSMMDLHGAVVSRMVEILNDGGDAGRSSLSKLAADPLICGLLVLYGVHPVPMDERVKKAIDRARPQLNKKGARRRVAWIDQRFGKRRYACISTVQEHGCGSSPDALKSTLEQAILEAAPEIVEIVVEGVPSSSFGFVAINTIQSATQRGRKL